MIKRNTWPLRARMTLLAGGVMALASLLVSVLVVVAARGQADDYQRNRTARAALSVLPLIKRDRLPTVLPPRDHISVQVVNARGQVVSSTPDLVGRPRMARLLPPETTTIAYWQLCPPQGMRGCMDVIGLRIYETEGDWIVYAADEAIPWYVSGALVAFLVAVSLMLVLLSVLGASRTVSKTLAPVEAIRTELDEISASDTGRRVPVPENRDEIRRLAQTVNATLERLDAALVQMRRFTSDASHDLRSPITAARAQVEEALLYPEETDWPMMAIQVLGSLERLQAIVTDLLELAALDAGAHQAADIVDLAGLVSSEVERQPRRVPIRTDLASGVTVRGDPLRLSRLLVNLLDNAERHANSEVCVIVRAEDGTAVMEVRDDGAGIPPEYRETVFQRFARLDAARNRDAGGTGLGLPIARQTAAAHGGTLVAEDSSRGARLVLRLPLARSPQRSG